MNTENAYITEAQYSELGSLIQMDSRLVKGLPL
jgi:hypothetical protein